MPTRVLPLMFVLVAFDPTVQAEPDSFILQNEYVLRELRLVDGTWRTVRLARADGGDEILVDSDEFHILPLDSEQGWTVDDYLAETRKPTRSHLHFNNWYSSEAKFITRENFVKKTARPIVEKLAKYGAHLDAMVPDHGWLSIAKSILYRRYPKTSYPSPFLRRTVASHRTSCQRHRCDLNPINYILLHSQYGARSGTRRIVS